MTQKININLKQVLLSFAGMALLSVAILLATPRPVTAAVGECDTLPSDRGLATHEEDGVGEGEYTVFARVKVDSGDATFDLSIDGEGGALCDYQVSQGGSNGDWVWFESNGTLDWTGGDMRFQMSGDKDGVGLDCIVLFDLNQGSFNPSSKEDCNPTGGGGEEESGDPGGCTPVSGTLATTAVLSFLEGNVKTGADVFDTNNDDEISGTEATSAVLKFLGNECP